MSSWTLACAVGMLGACIAAWPAHAAQTAPVGDAAVLAETDQRHWNDLEGALRMASNHPNELWRLHGAQSAARGEWRDALGHFRRAALYADKYSQHRLSLMYWHGVGVERDRASGYIWADLAAERGYPQFLALREKMWEALDADERARVQAEGAALYQRYGDPAGKLRFARALSRASRNVTGSRTGFIGNLQVDAPGTDGSLLSGMGASNIADMYGDWRWNAQRYWAVEDAIWHQGNVGVGPMEKIETAPDAPKR